MSRKPDSDGRQQDFFGAPAAKPKEPKAAADKLLKARTADDTARRETRKVAPAPNDEEPDPDRLHDQIARLSPAELRELTATLTDDALGQLTLATIRQLKRRLTRESRHGSKGRSSTLARAAQQLIAEFGGQGDEDDF